MKLSLQVFFENRCLIVIVLLLTLTSYFIFYRYVRFQLPTLIVIGNLLMIDIFSLDFDPTNCNRIVFFQIIGSAKICYASERSTVDPNGKVMTLKTINLTFCRHISVDELLYYAPHPTEPSKTLLKQEATVSVSGVPLSHYMEDLLTSRISSNAGNGRAGLEWVISKINTEVILSFLFYFFFCNKS